MCLTLDTCQWGNKANVDDRGRKSSWITSVTEWLFPSPSQICLYYDGLLPETGIESTHCSVITFVSLATCWVEGLGHSVSK